MAVVSGISYLLPGHLEVLSARERNEFPVSYSKSRQSCVGVHFPPPGSVLSCENLPRHRTIPYHTRTISLSPGVNVHAAPLEATRKLSEPRKLPGTRYRSNSATRRKIHRIPPGKSFRLSRLRA
jgi:hypothetical protein